MAKTRVLAQLSLLLMLAAAFLTPARAVDVNRGNIVTDPPQTEPAKPWTDDDWIKPQPLEMRMQGYDYPYPVSYLSLSIEGRELRMAYMDVAPQVSANGRTVLLLHGKNFPAAYWGSTIAFLSGQGYRVLAPDQIGFGKSDKPELSYSFDLLARNTAMLLDSLGIESAVVLGHSMGGMLASRFALNYPERTEQLVLVNPIGLEDYGQYVASPTVDELEQKELSQDYGTLRSYHRKYYVEWDLPYEEWPMLAYRLTLGDDWPQLARVNALTASMIWNQPVIHDFDQIRVPTLLIIGQEDRTALGKDLVSAELAATMGQYPRLGREAAAAIPDAELVELPGVGHLPQLEAPERFRAALLGGLSPQ